MEKKSSQPIIQYVNVMSGITLSLTMGVIKGLASPELQKSKEFSELYTTFSDFNKKLRNYIDTGKNRSSVLSWGKKLISILESLIHNSDVNKDCKEMLQQAFDDVNDIVNRI